MPKTHYFGDLGKPRPVIFPMQQTPSPRIAAELQHARELLMQKLVQKQPIPSEAPRVGELTAYRIWRIDGHILRSLSQNAPWIPGGIMEGNPAKSTVFGQEGIYAFKELANAEKMLTRHRAIVGRQILQEEQTQQTHLIGSVKLWGDIVEHERGYRAQFARVVSLIAAPSAIQQLYVQGVVPNELTEVRNTDAKLIGVTTIKLPTDRNFMMTYKKESVPPTFGMSNISNSTTINQHCFEIKTIAASGKRCLCATPKQDLTVLPGWLPCGW